MPNLIIKDFIGGLLIFSSIFDSWKYIWNAQSIQKIGTARGHSRKFINAALFNDLTKLSYGMVILDGFIVFSSILALGTMSYLFYTIYKYYPYKYRGLHNFKRPNIFIYFLNSVLPNQIRRRL
jgi:hypothetical protein